MNTASIYYLKDFHTFTLLFTNGFVGLLASFIICPLDSTSVIFHDFTNADFGFLTICGILYVLGLFLCIYSAQILIPVFYSVLRCQEVVIAFLFQIFIRLDIPDLQTIFGAILVLFCSLILPIENQVLRFLTCNKSQL